MSHASAHAGAAAHGPGDARKPHVLPLRTYFLVWGGLLLLTVVTVYVSYLHFGTWNLIVAMLVATTKASLVALFFVHLKYDEKFNGVIFLASLAFLGIFFVLTLADTVERGSVDEIEAREILPVPARADFMRERGIPVPAADGSLPAAADSAAADTAAAPAGAPAGASPGHGSDAPSGH